MNRQIKFRAFDGKRMLFCAHGGHNDFIIEGGEVSLFGEFDLRERKTPDWPLMQWTGLLDKNGVEIYEGDIINLSGDEFYTNESFSCDEMDFTGKVSMNSLLWMVDSDNCWVPLCDCLHEEFEIEIIGNIHEHPELLEQQ